ncbi:hypothetical protein RRG08_027318 [Elysia crispata]|uniref:Uncharacterized protein n=1 Tax=Elysia crispata TaxID=231223 RepID=A0AAE0ZBC2_9GAST|nr:hypothetical protein RRG08_027318 [Elysia crispata]
MQRTLSQLLCSDKLEFFCEIPPVCVNNSFGGGCTEHCSPYCAGANKTCDVKSGSCDFGCVDGYYGTMCDRAKTDSPQTSFFYSKAAIIYIVVFVSAGISACVILAPVNDEIMIAPRYKFRSKVKRSNIEIEGEDHMLIIQKRHSDVLYFSPRNIAEYIGIYHTEV